MSRKGRRSGPVNGSWDWVAAGAAALAAVTGATGAGEGLTLAACTWDGIELLVDVPSVVEVVELVVLVVLEVLVDVVVDGTVVVVVEQPQSAATSDAATAAIVGVEPHAAPPMAAERPITARHVAAPATAINRFIRFLPGVRSSTPDKRCSTRAC